MPPPPACGETQGYELALFLVSRNPESAIIAALVQTEPGTRGAVGFSAFQAPSSASQRPQLAGRNRRECAAARDPRRTIRRSAFVVICQNVGNPLPRVRPLPPRRMRRAGRVDHAISLRTAVCSASAPARAAYSHSASVSNRNRPAVTFESHLQNSEASCQLTATTG
jgi:hypothetical protein